MKREDVIKMAREVGVVKSPFPEDYPYHFNIEELERFAQAVRATTKEEDAKICEKTKGLDRQGWPKHYEAHEIAAAIRASK